MGRSNSFTAIAMIAAFVFLAAIVVGML